MKKYLSPKSGDVAEEQTVYKELVSMFDEKQTKDKEQGYLPKLEQGRRLFIFKPSRLGFRNESDKLFQF